MHFYFDLTLVLILILGLSLNAHKFRQNKQMQKTITQDDYLLKKISETMGICIWSKNTSPDAAVYNIIYGTEELFGRTTQDYRQNPMLWKNLVHPEDISMVEESVRKVVEEGRTTVFDHRIVKPNNEIRWITTRIAGIKDNTGNITQKVGLCTDSTEHIQMLLQIKHLSLHDNLTNLPNRNLFQELCANALAKAKRQKSMLGFMYIDLDKFKEVNDNFGHFVGDILLQLVAERLKDCIRKSDNVARMGGDEFAIVLADIKALEDASETAQRIVNGMSRPFMVNEHELSISASVGISLFPTDGEEIDTLIKKADATMYKVKEEGKNNYQFYNSSSITHSFPVE